MPKIKYKKRNVTSYQRNYPITASRLGHLEDSNELSCEIRHGIKRIGRLVMTAEAIKELKNDIR